MKNSIVAVWGGPGAGKTTLSCALASILAGESLNVLLCNPDPALPACYIWGITAGLPSAGPEYDEAQPIRRVLSHPDLTPEYIGKRVAVYPKDHRIGLLGCFLEETHEQYKPITGSAADSFLLNAKKLAPVTLVDCMTPQQDELSKRAIGMADVLITLVEPNVAGVGFLSAQKQFLKETPHKEYHLTVAAKTRSTTPVDEFSYTNNIQFSADLPFMEDVIIKRENLELFSRHPGDYGKTVLHIAEIIRGAVQDE